MKSLPTAALLLGTAAAAASAQTATRSPFLDEVAQAESAWQLGEFGLRGTGAAVLTDAISDARYVLVGEAHFSTEIPRFTSAICRLMAPKGLTALAVEAGPQAALIINDSLRRPDRVEQLSAFMRQHPDAMAFQNNASESEMAAACAKEAGPAFQVWGLDQEFFGASGFLLEQMAAASPGPTASAAIEKLRAQDRLASAEALASGSPGKFLIYTVTDAQIDATRAAIAKDGGAGASRAFEALAETRAIFLASASGDGDPNGRRARLIKRTLVAYLAGAPEGSRVLMKFGDVHMVKGINSLRQRDLGNFVAERADGEGVRSLHILAVGLEGQLAVYNGVGQQVKPAAYAPLVGSSYPWLKDVVAARPKQAGASDWLLVDLRKLRSRSGADMSPEWRRLVEGYDLVVVAPKFTPASLLGVEPEVNQTR